MLQSIPAADFLPWKAAGGCDMKTSLQKFSATHSFNRFSGKNPGRKFSNTGTGNRDEWRR